MLKKVMKYDIILIIEENNAENTVKRTGVMNYGFSNYR